MPAFAVHLPEIAPFPRLLFFSMILFLLVGVAGFEPAAPASRRQCSTRLSYTPISPYTPWHLMSRTHKGKSAFAEIAQSPFARVFTTDAMTQYFGITCCHASGTARGYSGKRQSTSPNGAAFSCRRAPAGRRERRFCVADFHLRAAIRTPADPVACGAPGISRNHRIARRTETGGLVSLMTVCAHCSWRTLPTRLDDRVPVRYQSLVPRVPCRVPLPGPTGLRGPPQHAPARFMNRDGVHAALPREIQIVLVWRYCCIASVPLSRDSEPDCL